MTRDEALIRAALDMAADMIEESAKDAMDAADTSDIGSIIATWLNDEADAIRAIDPAEVLAKVGEAETTPAPDAGARLVEAAMHLLSEYDAPNPVDDAVSKLRTALVACKEARDD